MSDGLEAVRAIVERWPELTLEEWQEICTPDVKYQNMPWDRVVTEGPDGIHGVLADFAGRFDVQMEVRHLGVDGDTAYSERIEHFRPSAGTDGEEFDLPVTGVFELRDGKVAAWRDYFDRRAMKA